jgi:opacity protein-like surface antigen
LLFAAGALMSIGAMQECTRADTDIINGEQTQIDTVVYVDTVKYDVPQLRDSIVLCYRTVRLPLTTTSVSNAPEHIPKDSLIIDGAVSNKDSVDVEIPITQREYRDSTYRAWVSGYDAKLDSIEVYNSHSIVTIEKYVPRTRHWGVGISAGYGYTPKGAQPYIGIGISYSIFTW